MVQCNLLLMRVQPTANPNQAFPVQPTANPNRAFQVQSKSIANDWLNKFSTLNQKEHGFSASKLRVKWFHKAALI